MANNHDAASINSQDDDPRGIENLENNSDLVEYISTNENVPEGVVKGDDESDPPLRRIRTLGNNTIAVVEEVNADQDFEKGTTDYESSYIKKLNTRQVLTLGFSTLGAIYGDIGTSPLYVLNSIKYPDADNMTKDDILGAISIIFYLFTFIVIFKYVCIVLFIGPNNGEGGQVAIYAKICRFLKIGLKGIHIPGSPEKSDMELLTRQDTSASWKSTRSDVSRFSKMSERLAELKNKPSTLRFISKLILVLCFLGCALLFSDGLLTPTTSVLSAVGGIQIAKPSFSNNNVLAVSEVILFLLFAVQQFGSHKISFSFAPIVFLWMIGLLVCGIYNLVHWGPGIFRALSPYYAIQLLKKQGIDVMSGAMLAITGTEAMFADVGHFGRLPIQLTLGCFVYPCLIITYLGQGAFLLHNLDKISNPFYYSIPGGTNSAPYWIMFVLAILATIIASQALILGVFSIVTQLINLDCFPKFKIVHVSKEHIGKVYIPGVNWLLMVGVLLTTAGFKTSANVTASYGLGISLDFTVTSILLVILMVYVYEVNILIPIVYALIFLSLEATLVIANLKKVPHGAWFTIMMCVIFFSFLSFWRWARQLKLQYDLKSNVRIGDLYPQLKPRPAVITVDLQNNSSAVTTDPNIPNVNEEEVVLKDMFSESLKVASKFGKLLLRKYDGVAFMYNDSPYYVMRSPNSVPNIYAQMVRSFVSLPRVFIFCYIRVLSIPSVPPEDRILLGCVKDIPDHYKCVLRFGYSDNVVIDADIIRAISDELPLIEGIPVEDWSTLHIFENNRIFSRDRAVEEGSTNIFMRFLYGIRKVGINLVFSPLHLMFLQNYDSNVKFEDDSEEVDRKLYLGRIVKI